MIFDHGIELPHFAAFVLLDDPAGLAALRSYYQEFVGIPLRSTASEWIRHLARQPRLGRAARVHAPAMLADIDRRGVDLLDELRAATPDVEVIISGCIGPRGDGYRADDQMTPDEACRYHAPQIAAFAGTSADLVSALTFSYADEAVGVASAARSAGIPCVISFTVETDGRLPSGQSLEDAIREVDAATDESVAYFMINCAHPTHFSDVPESGDWRNRIRGVRANASAKSHAELDEAAELDSGDPVGPRGGVRRLEEPPAEPDGGRGMLRHRQPSRRGDLCGSDGLVAAPPQELMVRRAAPPVCAGPASFT